MGDGLLVENAELRCTHGSVNPMRLGISSCHGYTIGGRSVINEDDARPGENIPRFGMCTITGELCKPDIINEKWLSTESNLTIGGKPAVTTVACCQCAEGGLIYPETTGQEDIFSTLIDQMDEDWLLFGLMNGIFVGDPINVCTGNFVDQKTDLEISGSYPLVLKRTYNAMDKRSGVLDRGWRHSFEVQLDEKQDCVEVTMEDGRVLSFQPSSSRRYTSQTSQAYVLKTPDRTYELVTELDGTYTFDQSGRCMEICDLNGNKTAFRYSPDKLSGVENISGSFMFDYDSEGHLCMVTDSFGRKVSYTYDRHGTLCSVESVTGVKTEYLYDRYDRLMAPIGPSGEPEIINAYNKKGRVEKQYFADGGMMQFEYDAHSGRTIVTEQNGNRVRYYQNAQQQNVKTVYYDGSEETDYNDKGLKTRFQDKNGNEFFYEYDAAGNMIRETNPLGVVAALEYNKQNMPTKITIADESITQLAYDSSKNLISAINPLGHQTKIQYHKGLPSEIVLPDGSVLCMTYDAKLNVSAIQLPTGATMRYEYDRLNRVSSVTDGNGGITKLTHNDRNEITEVINPDGKSQTYEYKSKSRISKITCFDGGVIEYKYNDVGRVEEIINQAGDSTKFTYDLMWNVTNVTDPCGNEVQYSYDKLSRLVEIKDAEGNATRYEHDPKGNVTAVISPLGARTELVYDALDRPQEVKEPDGSVTKLVYDKIGNLTETTDALGNVTGLEYDLAGQLVGITDALGNKTTVAYTVLGQIAHIITANSEKIAFDYYPGGQMQSVHLPSGESETYEYDKNGNLVKKIDAFGNETTLRYDSINRVTEVINPLGHSKQFAYDALGNITQVIDEIGGVTQYKYSSLGDIIEVIDTTGHSTKYGYDKAQRLTRLEQFRLIDDDLAESQVPEYQITTYEYDKAGNIIAVQTPLGAVAKYRYDGAGNVVSKLDEDGLETLYEYNLAGQLTKVAYADGKTAKLFYNPLKQLTRMQDWLGTTQIELDPLGRATQVTDFDGKTVGYAWDSVGRREKTIYPDGNEVRYSYNVAGLLDIVHAPEGETRYAYDSAGRAIERTLPDNTRSTYRFDPLGRISRLAHTDKYGHMLDEFNYTYDPTGNITNIRKQRKGLDSDSGLFQYAYDPLGQLTSVKHGKDVQQFAYDELGNRIKHQHGDQMTQYIYNALNQLVQTHKSDIVSDYSYDGRGNLTQITENGRLRQSFTFDAMNRMVEAVTAGKGKALYTYDGLLNRVKKQESVADLPDPTQELRYIIDRTRPYDNLLMTEGTQNQNFTWSNELISVSGQSDVFYLQDHLGSPIRLMERTTQGLPQAYDVFGERTKAATGVKQPFGFTGYTYEPIADMCFAQARYYDASAGRFAARDTHWHPGNMIFGDESLLMNGYSPVPDMLAMGQSKNLYGYTISNPLNYIDPTGLCGEDSDSESFFRDFADDFLYKLAEKPRDIFLGSIIGGSAFAGRSGTPFGKLAYWHYFSRRGAPGTARNTSLTQSGNTFLRHGRTLSRAAPFAVPAVFIAIDVVLNAVENRRNGVSWERTGSDAVADTAIGVGVVMAGGFFASVASGAKKGAVAGSVVPGKGTLAGAVVGALVGAGAYAVANALEIRETISDVVYSGVRAAQNVVQDVRDAGRRAWNSVTSIFRR